MFKVVVIDEYMDEEEFICNSLIEANNLLYKWGFTYDSYSDPVHVWALDQFTHATVEKID